MSDFVPYKPHVRGRSSIFSRRIVIRYDTKNWGGDVKVVCALCWDRTVEIKPIFSEIRPGPKCIEQLPRSVVRNLKTRGTWSPVFVLPKRPWFFSVSVGLEYMAYHRRGSKFVTVDLKLLHWS